MGADTAAGRMAPCLAGWRRMVLLIRIVLGAAGVLTTALVARDAANFGVVQAMVGMVLIATIVLVASPLAALTLAQASSLPPAQCPINTEKAGGSRRTWPVTPPRNAAVTRLCV